MLPPSEWILYIAGGVNLTIRCSKLGGRCGAIVTALQRPALWGQFVSRLHSRICASEPGADAQKIKATFSEQVSRWRLLCCRLWRRVDWYKDKNFSDELSTSIFQHWITGCRLLQNVQTFLLVCTASPYEYHILGLLGLRAGWWWWLLLLLSCSIYTIDKECSTHGRDENCTLNFGRELST